MRSIRFAGVVSSVSVETSAAARWEGKGGIELWLTDNIQQVDLYEVAASLCRLLFNTRKANDALLLMTILSSDLRTLRKRGCPGNREFPSFYSPTNCILVVGSMLQWKAPIYALVKEIDETAVASPQTTLELEYMSVPAPVAASDLRALRKPGSHGGYATPLFFNPADWILVVNRIFQQKEDEGAPREALYRRVGKTLFSRPKHEHSGEVNIDRSNIALKTNSFMDGDSKGQPRLGFIDRLFSSKTPPSKVPQVPKKPTIDLVSFTDIGGVAPTTLGIGQLMGIFTSLKY